MSPKSNYMSILLLTLQIHMNSWLWIIVNQPAFFQAHMNEPRVLFESLWKGSPNIPMGFSKVALHVTGIVEKRQHVGFFHGKMSFFFSRQDFMEFFIEKSASSKWIGDSRDSLTHWAKNGRYFTDNLFKCTLLYGKMPFFFQDKISWNFL